MGIGLIGKPNGVRIVTGSEHYGMRKQEGRNLELREFPTRFRGRSVMIIGQTAKQVIEYIHPAVVEPVKVKKARKPAVKKVVAEA